MTVSVDEVRDVLLLIGDSVPLDTSGADDEEETVDDWWQGLRHYTLEDLEAAVRRWAERYNRWPTRMEFYAEVAEASGRNRRADAIRRGLADPRPDTVCPECGLHPNAGGTHLVEEADNAGVLRARPCSLCEPDLYRRFVDGHYPSHGPGECSDPTCQARNMRRRR